MSAVHLHHSNPNAASQVFNIPELLELILLSLPWSRACEEIHSSRFILLSQTASRTWQQLLDSSPLLRNRLYRSCPQHETESTAWLHKISLPPAQPNPWIPYLLLQRRTWGSTYPFDNIYNANSLDPSQPKLWTYTLEISRGHAERFPEPGHWRSMVAASPPFCDMYCVRKSYQFGSGRTPVVTFSDEEPSLPKWKQKHVVHNDRGITLGDIADAVEALFAIPTSNHVKWVKIESIRRPELEDESEEVKDARDGMPQTLD